MLGQAAEAASSSVQLRTNNLGDLLKMALAFSLWRISPRDCRRRLTMVESYSPAKIAFCLASTLHTL